jgi:3-isopropylmalate/(R)-2-methylmalate dehydratase small subunit
MKAFQRVSGIAIPLPRADIDTDAIIPQQWLITTERTGLGSGLFGNWRYLNGTRAPDPGFILNDPRLQGARILVAGPNYGCGSSREHAVWAHLDFGIEAVIAPSFGQIFYDNALKNGLAAVTLEASAIAQILASLLALPGQKMTVDLLANKVTGPDGATYGFAMAADRREALLLGRDDIAATLEMADAIEAFQQADRRRRPWVWEAKAADKA